MEPAGTPDLLSSALVPASKLRFRRRLGALLSLLIPGAGHFLLGSVGRGVLWVLVILLVGPVILLALDSLSSAQAVGVGLAVGLFLMFLAMAAMVVDVVRLPASGVPLPSWRRVFVTLTALVIVVAILGGVVDVPGAIRERYLQAFRLPAGSMIPSLLVGDYFLVNKFIYRFRDPARGDVVVFRYPVDESRDFIKRVIAVGGEAVFIKERQVYINCQPPESTCQPMREPWAYYEDRLGMRSETWGPHRVPPGSYFVMGDNRHNSQDSRYWGFVKREKIGGKAFIIYWSWDSDRGAVRWDRLGRLIH